MNPQQTLAEIFGLYEQHGTADYIGEPVSQIEHMSQAAQLAMAEGFDDEVVLAAFFHDIGHICGQGGENMGGFGGSATNGWGRIICVAQGSASAWPSWWSITCRPSVI